MTPPNPCTPDRPTGPTPAGPTRSEGEGGAATRAGGMGVDRLVLLTVAIATSLSLVSFRYHLAISNYGRFICEQVLPASGIRASLAADGQPRPVSDVEGRIATYGTPYFPPYIGRNQRRISGVGSDYLGVWHYTRELLRGRNPYDNRLLYQYVSRSDPGGFIEAPQIRDAGVPEQAFGSLSYFPMGVVLLLAFYLPNYFASLALYYAAFLAFVLGLCSYLVVRSPGHRVPAAILATSMFLTSFPIGFLLDRGNVEGIVFMLLALGVAAYSRAHPRLAAVLIGLASSAKMAPAVFFGLFLLDRRFGPLALGLAVLFGSNAAAMLTMHEDPATIAGQLASHLGDFSRQVTSDVTGSLFNHSLLNAIRGLAHPFVGGDGLTPLMRRLAPTYGVATAIAAGLCLVGLRGRPFANRVLVLTVILLLFPAASYDYKLIHLYIAFGLIWLDIMAQGAATRPQVVAALLLAVLFSPKSYRYGAFEVGSIINASCMTALLALGLAARLGPAGRTIPPRPAGAGGVAAAVAT